MTKVEARQCVEDIRHSMDNLRQRIRELYDREGWKALGYRSWHDCVMKEFGKAKSRLYQELGAARIEANIQQGDGSTMVEIPERQLRPLVSLSAGEQREAWQEAVKTAPGGKVTGAHVAAVVADRKRREQAEREKDWLTLSGWSALSATEYQRILNQSYSLTTFNQTNENIEWAAWSWNPVTGCRHGCQYCYAHDIANRFYPQKFEPSFYPNRLNGPAHTRPGTPRWEEDTGYRRVFVCSMADLFGDWVPQDWIRMTVAAIRAAPQWTGIFLTKNPARLIDIEWPDNAWVGATVDRQQRVRATEEAFRYVAARRRFVSCEPLLEPVTFSKPDLFDWYIIGGCSGNARTSESQPEWRWVHALECQALDVGAMVYHKTNLKVRAREYPDD